MCLLAYAFSVYRVRTPIEPPFWVRRGRRPGVRRNQRRSSHLNRRHLIGIIDLCRFNLLALNINEKYAVIGTF